MFYCGVEGGLALLCLHFLFFDDHPVILFLRLVDLRKARPLRSLSECVWEARCDLFGLRGASLGLGQAQSLR